MTYSDPTSETSRRGFLAGAAASIARAGGPEPAVRGGRGDPDLDPVVSLWRDWLIAHRLFSEACRRQQKLETEMLREFGSFPRVKIACPDDGDATWAYTTDAINRLLQDPEQERMRRKEQAELAARIADWNALDVRFGYSKAKRAEAEAAELEDECSQILWRTAPRSFAGVAAKLHCVLEMEDPGSGLQDAPWPQLRAILADLVRVAERDDHF